MAFFLIYFHFFLIFILRKTKRQKKTLVFTIYNFLELQKSQQEMEISKAKENAKIELKNLESELLQTIESYCEKRNANTKGLDLVREISAQIGDLSLNFFTGNFFLNFYNSFLDSEEFFEIIKDIHNSLDSSSFNLQNFEQILLSNFELVNKLNVLYLESINSANKMEEKDFDQVIIIYKIIGLFSKSELNYWRKNMKKRLKIMPV